MNRDSILRGAVLNIPYEKIEGETDNDVLFLVVKTSEHTVSLLAMDQCHQWEGDRDNRIVVYPDHTNDDKKPETWTTRGQESLVRSKDEVAKIAEKIGIVPIAIVRDCLTKATEVIAEDATSMDEDGYAHYKEHLDSIHRILSRIFC